MTDSLLTSKNETELILSRAAGWLTAPNGEARKSTVELIVALRNEVRRLSGDSSAPETSGEWVRLDHDTIEQNQPVLMRRTGSPQIPMWQMWRSSSAQETSEHS